MLDKFVSKTIHVIELNDLFTITNVFGLMKDSEGKKTYWIIATHSDTPINLRLYLSDEMRKAIKSWTYPYQRPVLRHHNEDSDPIGRVVYAEYFLADERFDVSKKIGYSFDWPEKATGAILLKVEIYDEDAIAKIDKGIYKTVSVGFSASHMTCSICGKDMMKCEHIPGKKYKGQTAYAVPHDISYREVSFVSVPADQYAMTLGEEVEKENTKTETGDNDGVIPEHDEETTKRSGDAKHMHEEAVPMELEKKIEELQKRISDMESAHKELETRYKKSIVTEIIKAKEALGVEGYIDLSDEKSKELFDKYLALPIDFLELLIDELNQTMDALMKAVDECDDEKDGDESEEEAEQEEKKEPEAEDEEETEDEDKAEDENKNEEDKEKEEPEEKDKEAEEDEAENKEGEETSEDSADGKEETESEEGNKDEEKKPKVKSVDADINGEENKTTNMTDVATLIKSAFHK